MEALHQLSQRQAHIVESLRAAVQRLQAVHQHDLAVKAQEVVFVKALHHFFAVIFKAFAQHSGVAVFIRLGQLRFADGVDIRPGEKLQGRRPGHISRQHKAPRLNKVQSFSFAGMQILRPRGGNLRQTVFIRRRQRIQPVAELTPASGPRLTLPLQQAGHLPRPAEVILRQHR